MSPGWVSVWCVLLRLQGAVPAKQGGAEQCGNVSKDTKAVRDLQPAPVPLAATAPLLWGWAGLQEPKWGDLHLSVTCQDPEYFSSHFGEAQVSERQH